jgi:hypothetical protein
MECVPFYLLCLPEAVGSHREDGPSGTFPTDTIQFEEANTSQL